MLFVEGQGIKSKIFSHGLRITEYEKDYYTE